MIVAVVVLSVVTGLSLVATILAIISARKANEANSAVASQFVSMVLNNSDKVDFFENGEHKATSFTFPNEEGF